MSEAYVRIMYGVDVQRKDLPKSVTVNDEWKDVYDMFDELVCKDAGVVSGSRDGIRAVREFPLRLMPTMSDDLVRDDELEDEFFCLALKEPCFSLGEYQSPGTFDPSDLVVHAGDVQRAKEFCNRHGFEWDNPKWVVSVMN